MELTPNDIAQIEQYLSNEMSDADKARFEKRIAQDQALHNEVHAYRQLLGGFGAVKQQEFHKQVQGWEQELQTPKTPPRRLWLRWAAAAAILLLPLFWWLLQSQPNPPQLALQAYHSPILPINRLPKPQQSDFQKGIQALQQEKQKEAIHLLKSIPDYDPNYVIAQYYLGHAYFQQQQYRQAVDIFANVVDWKDDRFSKQAEWFKVLARIADEQDFKAELNKLLTDKLHPYQPQAAVLAEKLGFQIIN